MQLLLSQARSLLILIRLALPERPTFCKMRSLEQRRPNHLSTLPLPKPINQLLHFNKTNPPKALNFKLDPLPHRSRLPNKITSQPNKFLNLFNSRPNQLSKAHNLSNNRKPALALLSSHLNLSKEYRISRLQLKFLKIKAKKPLLRIKVFLPLKQRTWNFNNKNNLNSMNSLNNRSQRSTFTK